MKGRWPFALMDFNMEPRKAALVIIDMQYYDAHADYGLGLAARLADPEGAKYYLDRLQTISVPAIRRLLEAFRTCQLPIVHITIGSETQDGKDLSPIAKARTAKREERARHKAGTPPKGSFEHQILPELAPLTGELIINKTTTGAFNSSNLEVVLRNMGIEQLIICGVVTNGCVETTARDAADKGFWCTLVEDGCAALEEEAHKATLHSFQAIYGMVRSSGEILAILNAEMAKPIVSA